MESDTEYQYSPLLEPDAFRIIKLHPSPSISDPISCSLVHSTLSHYDNSIADNYIAISYVWGDASDRCSITIDGKALSITASLDSALRHIRDSEQEIRVWADGVCINQSDVKDKNKQVTLMGAIFQVATYTIIYLGESSPETKEILDVIASRMSNGKIKASNEMDTLAGSPQELNRFKSLARDHILKRNWFKRVWILQELILSKDPRIQVGSDRLKWNVFTEFLLKSGLQDSEDQDDKCLVNMQNLQDQFHVIKTELGKSRQIIKTSYYYLLKVLHSRRGHGVSDGRDFLYAHLGLFQRYKDNQGIEDLIRVDYGKSMCEVFTDLALYLFRSQQSFDFLSHIEDRAIEDRNRNLPSWVPDWTVSDVTADAQHHLGASTPTYEDMTHIILGGPLKVFACIGHAHGIIEVIKDDMLSTAEFDDLTQELKQLDRMDCVHIDGEPPRIAYNIIREHFRKWLHKNIKTVYGGQSISESALSEILSDFRSFDGKVLRKFRSAEGYTKLWHYRFSYFKNNKTLLENLFIALMSNDSTKFLASKNVAVLDTERIALVPRWARVGDFICTLDEKSTASFVFRTVDPSEAERYLDVALIKFFTELKEAKTLEEADFWYKTDTSKVGHFQVVGECIIGYGGHSGGTLARYAKLFAKFDRRSLKYMDSYIFALH